MSLIYAAGGATGALGVIGLCKFLDDMADGVWLKKTQICCSLEMGLVTDGCWLSGVAWLNLLL